MTKALRINFELDRADNPPLYDELMRFAKGVKRVSRLRTLAYAGLLSQEPRNNSCLAEASTRENIAGNVESATVAASFELFGPPIDLN